VCARYVETLECESARFDATDDRIARNGSRLGGAGVAETLSSRLVRDGGLGECAFALKMLENCRG
jgi:hypothetical protein